MPLRLPHRYGDAGGPKLGAWVQVENIGVNRCGAGGRACACWRAAEHADALAW